MIGKCLCEKIQFDISGDLPKLYQCHCSQCRKQSGASSNTATVVNADNFRWLCGEDNISKFRHVSGFRSHFCRTCGCPVPNPLLNTPLVWVPAGLLAHTGHSTIAAHIFVSSRGDWEAKPLTGEVFENMPDLNQFLDFLNAAD